MLALLTLLIPVFGAQRDLAIRYQPLWPLTPEISEAPRRPSPFDAWDRGQQSTFSFVSSLDILDSSGIQTDTVTLTWDPTQRTIDEVHCASPNYSLGVAYVRQRMVGVDTVRATRGMALSDSSWSWNKDSAQQDWQLTRVVSVSDSAAGKVYRDSSWYTPGDPTSLAVRSIWEHANAAGFLTRREVFDFDLVNWQSNSSDTIERDSDNRPIRELQWVFSNRNNLSYQWQDNHLVSQRSEYPELQVSITKTWWWGTTGKLDSASLYGQADQLLRASYDQEGRMIRQSSSNQTIRYGYTSIGQLEAIETNVYWPDDSTWRPFSLDSFAYDPQGRLAEATTCEPQQDTIDRTACSTTRYAYATPVTVETKFFRAPNAHVGMVGDHLVAKGQSGQILNLRVARADGKTLSITSGQGVITIASRDLQPGLIVWTLTSKGQPSLSGTAFLAASR